jgi:lysozyme
MIILNPQIIQKVNKFISFFEGRKHEAYKDSGGVWTIGLGSTSNVTPGLKITDAEIDARFEVDIQNALKRANDNVSTDLNDNESVCVISQAYNLRSFPKLADYLNQDRNLYKSKMLLYTKDAAGNTLKGLLIRRTAERLIFENRDWQKTALQLQKKSIPEIESAIQEIFTS